MSGFIGWQGQLGIGTSSPVSNRLDFQKESVMCHEAFVDTNGMRGTRSRDQARVRQGLRHIGGQIEMQPSDAESQLLLPWIFGGDTLTDALATRYITIDRGPGVFTYSSCAVDKCQWHCTQGTALAWTIDVVGVDETVGGSFPSLNLDQNPPWMFQDLSLSIGGTTVYAKEFDLTLDNAIDKERFFNSITLTQLLAHDRHVNFKTSLPYGDYSALYALSPGSNPASVTVTATFTNGAQTLAFSMANVKFPRMSPVIPGREEVFLPLEGIAYRNGPNTYELTYNIS